MGDWHLLEEVVSVAPEEAVMCCREACAHGIGIFNYSQIDSTDDDHRRRQLSLPSQLAPFASSVEARARRALSSRSIEVGAAVLLYSAPGCQRQALHTDYDTHQMAQELTDGADKPYVVLVAIMDDTQLIIQTNNEEAIVPIPTGGAIRFSGDVVHAGAAYSMGHTRLHFYAKTSSALEASGRTFLVGQSQMPQRSSRRAKWKTIKCQRDRQSNKSFSYP
jgi:hypothetical protein